MKQPYLSKTTLDSLEALVRDLGGCCFNTDKAAGMKYIAELVQIEKSPERIERREREVKRVQKWKENK